MKSLKKNALMFPAGYGKISKEEAYGIEGGIGLSNLYGRLLRYPSECI